MFCTHCGAKLDDDAQFCVVCGKKVENPNLTFSDRETPSASHPVPEIVPLEKLPELPEAVRSQAAEPGASEDTVPGAGRKKKFLLPLLLVVPLLAAAFFLFRPSGGPAAAADSKAYTNFNNGGQIAYDKSSIYFLAAYQDSDSHRSLYSTAYDGSSKKLLSDNAYIYRFRLAGDLILYGEEKDGFYTIGTMKKDGSSVTPIVRLEQKDSVYLWDFDLYHGTLYYLYDGVLHTLDKNGRDTVFAEDVTEFQFHADQLYYAAGGSIYSFDIKKRKKKELCKAAAYTLAFDDGFLYFQNTQGIYRMSAAEGGDITHVVDDGSAFSYLIDGDDLYYTHVLTGDELDILIKYATNNDTSLYDYYRYSLASTGPIYRVSKTGGTGEAVDCNMLVTYALYGTPSGLYGTFSSLSDKFIPLSFDGE